MGATPALKIYTAEGDYVGSAKEVMGAGVMAQAYGEGSTIRLGHNKASIVWTEGIDGEICESYDTAGALMVERAIAINSPFRDSIIY